MHFSKHVAAAFAVLAFIAPIASEAKLKKGDQFPNVKLEKLQGGGSVDLSAYKGKIVVVDFWASWCEPCKVEHPALNKLQAKYKDKGLVVLGVNLDENKADALTFLKDHPVSLELVHDGAKKALTEKLEIEVMPTSFILDKTGKIAVRHEGFRAGDEKKIEKEVANLLKK